MPYVKFDPPKPGIGVVLPTMNVSKITRKWLDIDYTPLNPHPDRKLDIYLPENGNGPFPTLICMHGGAFWGGFKNDIQNAIYMDAIPHGFAVACVEQRLCRLQPDGSYSPEGQFPNPIFDFKASIRFLRKNAAEYMLDPDRFALCGGSAGGYHVLIAAASAESNVLYDNSLGFAGISGEVQAVVSLFCVSDLIVQSKFTAENPFRELPDGTIAPLDNFADIFLSVNARNHPNLAHFASPATWITKAMPPTLLQHGGADKLVPAECSHIMYDKIRKICGSNRVAYSEFPEYTHGDIRFSCKENVDYIIGWLKSTLN